MCAYVVCWPLCVHPRFSPAPHLFFDRTTDNVMIGISYVCIILFTRLTLLEKLEKMEPVFEKRLLIRQQMEAISHLKTSSQHGRLSILSSTNRKSSVRHRGAGLSNVSSRDCPLDTLPEGAESLDTASSQRMTLTEGDSPPPILEVTFCMSTHDIYSCGIHYCV